MIYIRKVLENSEDKKGSRHEVLHANVHELLCYAVQEEYGKRADKLTMRSMEHGKPYFVEKDKENREIASDIHFNLSHSEEMVACVLSHQPVGIDIEKIRRYNPKVADRILSDEEWAQLQASGQKDRDFIRFWTLKEAYGKYTGQGLGTEFKRVQFHWDEDGNIFCSDAQVNVFQREIEKDYILSLCIQKSPGNLKLTNKWIDDKIYTC